jgi:hypothetical protein
MQITPTFLQERIEYNPHTGLLYWKPRTAEHFVSGKVSAQTLANRFNGGFAGKEAFTSESDGYRVSSVAGKMLKAHRVAWAIHYGEWPSAMIDHINRDRSDNRIANLRDVTREGNNRNFPSAAGSSSQYLGVYKSGRANKPWAASIKPDHKTVGLGRFRTEREAALAYNQAALSYFGEHASLNDV